MLINPHNTCANVLDTLRSSGLNYTLNETPYSVYLTVRKRFTKEYTPTQSTHNHQEATNEHNNNVVDMSKYEDVLAKLHDEISNHILTKRELAEREEELSQSVDANNWNIEDSRIQHFHQVETISKLTAELAQEVEEHELSEAALRKLEEKLENHQIQLEKASKDIAAFVEEKESLQERLEDAEQEIDNSRNVIKNLNEKLLHYEMKRAELSTLDTSLLKSKVHELEGTIIGKDNIISLLKHQATMSLKELNKIRQISSQSLQHSVSSDSDTLPHSEKLDPDTPLPLQPHLQLSQSCSSPVLPQLSSSSSQSGLTNTSLSHKTNSDLEKNKTVDYNRNNSSATSPPPATGLNKSFTNFTLDETESKSQHSSPGIPHSKNSEKYCQNCKNEIPDDIDVSVPSPVYFYDFLAECPSPWLHYGYCTPCLVMARFNNKTSITNHIAQCPAFLDQCWEGEHESLIAEYEQKEAESEKTRKSSHYTLEYSSRMLFIIL